MFLPDLDIVVEANHRRQTITDQHVHSASPVKSVHLALHEEAYDQRHHNSNDWLPQHKFLDPKQCAIRLKVQGRLSVNIVDDFDTKNDPQRRSEISVLQMTRLSAPKQGQSQKEQPICGIVTFLLPAVH